MKKRNVALILSLAYCGLGQIYKGEILKGINFAIVYTLLIVSFFVSHPASFLVHFLRILILIFMWFIGMIDSYVDDGIFIEERRWLMWQRPLALLPVTVVFCAIIILVILWTQALSPTNKSRRLIANVDVETISKIHNPNGVDAREQFNTSDFFSVQVAAFKEPEKAKGVCDEFLFKSYSARMENPELPGDNWYRVLIGKFQSKPEATAFAEKMREKEGVSYIIVHNSKADTK